MSEYVKAINTNQVLTGKELNASAITALIGTTTSPALKPYFRTEQMRTEISEELLFKFEVADAESYEWTIDGGAEITAITQSVDVKFQISIWTYLGDEWLKVFTRGNLSLGTYILKYGYKSPSGIAFDEYEDYISEPGVPVLNANIIIGSKTYVQIEPTVSSGVGSPFNSNNIWDWIDGGELVSGDNGSYSGFLEIGSFSAWVDNKDEF